MKNSEFHCKTDKILISLKKVHFVIKYFFTFLQWYECLSTLLRSCAVVITPVPSRSISRWPCVKSHVPFVKKYSLKSSQSYHLTHETKKYFWIQLYLYSYKVEYLNPENVLLDRFIFCFQNEDPWWFTYHPLTVLSYPFHHLMTSIKSYFLIS